MVQTDILSNVTDIASAPLVLDTITETLTDTVEEGVQRGIEFLPELIVGAILIAIGYYIASWLEPIAARLVDQIRFEKQLEDSPFGEHIHESDSPPQGETVESERGVGDGSTDSLPRESYGPAARVTGLLVKYYVILFSVFLAAEHMGLDRLGEWMERLVAYAPEFFAGVAVIIVGLLFADWAARRTGDSELASDREYGAWIPALVRTILYGVVLVIGLEMIGFDLQIVYMVVDGIASAIGVGLTFAIALALGVVAGLFAKDYYDENVASEASPTDQ